MSRPELDDTALSFPAYADLTQTVGWKSAPAPIRADTNLAAEAVETSQGSRYTEGAVLGTGGMGKVTLARDARIGRDVAVKVLHPDREIDPEDRARFLREAQVQGQLEHPSIVPVYDIERRHDGSTFFTMRRVHGRTLAAIIDDLRKGVPAAKTRYSQRELLTAFGTVCLAVDYAHTRGVIHRDLKPANIMLGDFGEVYVLDWGLARLVDEANISAERQAGARLSLPGTFLGTPMYVAPEQMADPDVGPSADVYSLGLILFEILTLERARDPNALLAPVDARPSVRAPHRNIAPELETVCVKATDAEPKERFSSARAIQEAISRFLDGDREIEQRRQLASQHVTAARIALGKSTEASADAEAERTTAMSELTRAVALDPTNAEHVGMLADIMANPPPAMPAAVVRGYEAETRRILKLGTHQSLGALGMWMLALPFFFANGFAHPWQAILIGVPMAVAFGFGIVLLGEEFGREWTQRCNIAVVMLCAVMVSRVFGPMILVPMIVVANTVVLQAHPMKPMQRYSIVVAVAAILVANGIEYFGVLPQSYLFEEGVWKIVPQLVELPRNGTFLFVTIASVATVVVPSLFIGRLRNELTDAQLRLATQAWHFQQLGARLMGKSEAT